MALSVFKWPIVRNCFDLDGNTLCSCALHTGSSLQGHQVHDLDVCRPPLLGSHLLSWHQHVDFMQH